MLVLNALVFSVLDIPGLGSIHALSYQPTDLLPILAFVRQPIHPYIPWTLAWLTAYVAGVKAKLKVTTGTDTALQKPNLSSISVL